MKLSKLTKLMKSKKFLVVIVLVSMCSFITGMILIFAYTPYQCAVEDLRSIDSDILEAMAFNNKEINDEMTFSIDVKYKLTDDEIRQLERIGVEIADWGHIPPFNDFEFHSYVVDCKIHDICKLYNLDFVLRIESLEVPIPTLNRIVLGYQPSV